MSSAAYVTPSTILSAPHVPDADVCASPRGLYVTWQA